VVPTYDAVLTVQGMVQAVQWLGVLKVLFVKGVGALPQMCIVDSLNCATDVLCQKLVRRVGRCTAR
jgi:hypothetical protein